MKHILTLLLSAALFSCTYETSPVNGGEVVRIPLRLLCEPLDTETGTESKSIHSNSELIDISNANYYLFRNGKLVRQEYFDNAANFAVSLQGGGEKHNLYILANVGERVLDSGTDESDIGTAIHIDYGSGSGYFSTIRTYGVPMAGTMEGFSSESSNEFPLKRLVHTLYVRMDTSGLESTTMEFTGLRIMQAPRDIHPFSSASKATYTIEGDAANLDSDDISRLNAGETVTLYLLENMRGSLLPPVATWKDKVPDKIPKTERELASYIEFSARAETVTAKYENNIYRAYLGNSPYDFSVKRSTYSTLTNSFINDAIKPEGWRIESDTPEITADLAFVDTRYTKETSERPEETGDDPYRPFRKVSSFYTMKGFTAIYYIYRSDPRMEYSLTMEGSNTYSSDCESFVTYKTSKLDDNFTALMINTTYPVTETGNSYLTSNPDFSSGKSVTFRLKSADGVIEDEMICRIITSPFGILFKYEGVPENEPVTDRGELKMYFTNPLGLRIQTEVSGYLSGFVSYKPNGTAFGNQTQEPKIVIDTGNLYSEPSFGGTSGYITHVVPSTGVGSRIDLYDDKTIYSGVISGIGGFHEYFRRIWNTAGWDSYTTLNGSNGYMKHAHPTELSLDIRLKFSSPNIQRLCPHSFSGNTFQLPVYFRNLQLTKDSSTGAYYGAGTDFGFIWHHYDNADYPEYTTYRFTGSTYSPDKSYYSGEHQVPVNVKINGTDCWRTDRTGVPSSDVVSDSFFSFLGFNSME